MRRHENRGATQFPHGHRPVLPFRVLTRVLLPLLLAGSPGCVVTQTIGLDVGPDPLVVFVDGKRLEEVPNVIELRANRDHTLFFQREGYLSQLVIVRTAEVAGEAQLEPQQVRLRLRRDATTAPSVSVELEEAEPPPVAP